MPTGFDHPSTQLALGGKIYWSELAQQLSIVWWEVTEVGGNVQHGDLHTDTTFTVVLPQHGGYCFHGPTPMDAWGKAKKWLMSPDRQFKVELPAIVSRPPAEPHSLDRSLLVGIMDIVSALTSLNATGYDAKEYSDHDEHCWCNPCLHRKANAIALKIRRSAE